MSNDAALPTKISKELEDSCKTVDTVIPTAVVSVKAARLAKTSSSLYKSRASANLKNLPELRGSCSCTKGGSFLSATIETYASTLLLL